MATYGREKEVESFLKSLKKSNYDLSLVEVIIVDQNDKIDLNPIVERHNDLNIKHLLLPIISCALTILGSTFYKDLKK